MNHHLSDEEYNRFLYEKEQHRRACSMEEDYEEPT